MYYCSHSVFYIIITIEYLYKLLKSKLTLLQVLQTKGHFNVFTWIKVTGRFLWLWFSSGWSSWTVNAGLTGWFAVLGSGGCWAEQAEIRADQRWSCSSKPLLDHHQLSLSPLIVNVLTGHSPVLLIKWHSGESTVK